MSTILVDNAEIRKRVRQYLKEKGIDTRPAFHPVHQMPMYYQEGVSSPVAEKS
jgi:perosamine synthetase